MSQHPIAKCAACGQDVPCGVDATAGSIARLVEEFPIEIDAVREFRGETRDQERIARLEAALRRYAAPSEWRSGDSRTMRDVFGGACNGWTLAAAALAE